MQCENLRVPRYSPLCLPIRRSSHDFISQPRLPLQPTRCQQHLALFLPSAQSQQLWTLLHFQSLLFRHSTSSPIFLPPKLPSSPELFACLTIIRRHGGYVSSPLASAAEAVVMRIMGTAVLISVRYYRRSCSSRYRQWVRSLNHTKATMDTWSFASGRLSGSLKTMAALQD